MQATPVVFVWNFVRFFQKIFLKWNLLFNIGPKIRKNDSVRMHRILGIWRHDGDLQKTYYGAYSSRTTLPKFKLWQFKLRQFELLKLPKFKRLHLHTNNNINHTITRPVQTQTKFKTHIILSYHSITDVRRPRFLKAHIFTSSLHCVTNIHYWYQLSPMEKTQFLLYN